jgi:hypothetical protein
MTSWRQIQHEYQLENDGEHIPYDRHYWTAQICSAGHVQHGGIRVMPDEKFCECGAGTIHQCPSCGGNIKGASRGFANSLQSPPLGCLKCGKQYPWTQKAMEKVSEGIDGDPALSASEKQESKTDLESIIKNTPGAESAARRTHGRLAKMGVVLRAAYAEYVVPLVAETLANIIKGG